MRIAPALLALLLLLAAATPAQAALNKPRHFEETLPYMAGLGNAEMTVVSGAVQATVRDASGSYGFFDSQGVTVGGLQQVCYSSTCQPTSGAPYRLEVVSGGSFALCFPNKTGGEFAADHSLALFVDFAQDDDLNSFGVDKSLVAPSLAGLFEFGSLPAITTPVGAFVPAPCTSQGGLTALDDTTVVHVRNGQATVQTLTGKSARISFTGSPTVTPVDAGFYIIPFNGGATAAFEPAATADAREGLDLARIQSLMTKLDGAHAGSMVEREQQPTGGEDTQDIVAGLLNGALLRLPEVPADGAPLSLEDSRFVRFSSLQVTGSSQLGLDGRAYFDLDDGKVAGAKPLVGVAMFQLPWWSYLLWVVAIGLFITRLALKPDKAHPVWDRFKWVGWVASPLVWILVFFLWDLEMRAVFGASLLHGTFGQFRLIVGLLQLGLLAIASFAAAAPLRIIGRNSALLAHQGTFMGISGAVGALLGFLVTATYLRAYLGVLFAQVLDKLA